MDHRRQCKDCFEKLLKEHEGHSDYCCLCISVPVGAHILGLLVTIGFFLNLIALLFALSDDGVVLICSSFVATSITTYPAWTYMLMVIKNIKTTRKRFAKAFKCFMKTTSVLVALSTLFLFFICFGNLKKPGNLVFIGFGIAVFLASWLILFFTTNFSRVV